MEQCLTALVIMYLFQMKEHFVFKNKLPSRINTFEWIWLLVKLLCSHCSLTVNEQWRSVQGYYRQTIRQALKQRLHRSKCSRLITSVMCKWKRKLKEKSTLAEDVLLYNSLLSYFQAKQEHDFKIKAFRTQSSEKKTAAYTLDTPMSLQWIEIFFLPDWKKIINRGRV